jgi:hypothetical protein
MTSFSSPDVMRFLGRRIPLSGNVPQQLAAELTSDVKRRQEGVRIKHRLGGNSIKLYDKAFTAVGNVLRGETAIHNVEDFRVYRSKARRSGGGLGMASYAARHFAAPAESAKEKRQRSAAISRKLRLLRAHGLLQKVPRTHRYQVTTAARKAITALLTARQATLAQLSSLAA